MPVGHTGHTNSELETRKLATNTLKANPLGSAAENIQELAYQPLRLVSISELVCDAASKHKSLSHGPAHGEDDRLPL